MHLRSKDELKSAHLTNKQVLIRCGFTRLEGYAFRISNPARWARMKSPAYWDKLSCALMDEASRIADELYLQQASLKREAFALKCKSAAFNVISYLNGHLFQFGIYIGHKWLLSSSNVKIEARAKRSKHARVTRKHARVKS